MLLRSHGGGNCSGDGGAHEGGPDLHPTVALTDFYIIMYNIRYYLPSTYILFRIGEELYKLHATFLILISLFQSKKEGKDQESIQSSTTPHLTQYTNGKVANSQLDITNESQEASPF